MFADAPALAVPPAGLRGWAYARMRWRLSCSMFDKSCILILLTVLALGGCKSEPAPEPEIEAGDP